MKVRCKNCGKEFNVFPSRIKLGRVKYCSMACYSRKGNNNPQYGKKRELSTKWNGGKRKSNGYIEILLPNGKRIYEHRLIVEEYLGRKLLKEEEIHHINEVRDDNRLKNLYLFKKGKHKGFHNLKIKPILKSNL